MNQLRRSVSPWRRPAWSIHRGTDRFTVVLISRSRDATEVRRAGASDMRHGLCDQPEAFRRSLFARGEVGREATDKGREFGAVT